MLDPKNNMALMSYMNFKDYRKTVEFMDKQTSAPSKSDKKGLMTYTKNMQSKNKQAKLESNGGDSELRKVLEYVKMIEGMKGGN